VVVNKIIQSDDANTPAVKAGLRKLDVILEINNEKILANEKQVRDQLLHSRTHSLTHSLTKY
jgi:S1-C subfamily serine protease